MTSTHVPGGAGRLIRDDAELAEIVRRIRSIAVVGAKGSDALGEPAHDIPTNLKRRGYRIVPVNPKYPQVVGETCYPTVSAIGARVDMINVFRRIDAIAALADEIIALSPALRPEIVWLQTGIRHDGAAAKLVEAGIAVVQDRCLGVYVSRFAR